jgi:hypothetical protein
MGAIRYYLPWIVELALLVYCLIDCIQTDEGSCRNLSKSWWILLIVILPIVGSVAWLVAGRPAANHTRRSVPWPSTQTAGFPEYERPRRGAGAPDDDPEFLAGLAASQSRHEQMLADWEAQLKEREARLRATEASGPQAASGPQDEGQSPDRPD